MRLKRVFPKGLSLLVAFGIVSCGGKATTAAPTPVPAAAPTAVSPTAAAPVTSTPSPRSRQSIPQWLDDAGRNAKFPQSVWAIGFSAAVVGPHGRLEEVRRRVTEDARNEMVKNITVRVTSASISETHSASIQNREIVSIEYGQIIRTMASAEVARVEIHDYHDADNDQIHVLAAVRWATLAEYYANMIEAGLSDAQYALELAEQAAETGRKKDVDDRLTEAKNKVESLALFRDLIIAVDTENGLRRSQGERANELLRQIAAAQVDAVDMMSVFVTGTEIILRSAADIIVPGLRAILSENDRRIAESRDEAGYILSINAQSHNSKFDGYFYHSESRVTVTLTNNKTGRNEVTTTIAGPKEGGMDAYAAGEEAFKAVIPEIWDKIKGKIMAD